MNDDPLYRPPAAADYLATPVATLQWWRHVGKGPTYVKLEGRVLYRRSALDAYLARSTVQPEAASTADSEAA